MIAHIVESAPSDAEAWTPDTLEDDLHHVAQVGLDLHSAMRIMPGVEAVSLRVRIDRAGQVTIEAPEFHPTRR
jgi:hypothetical protein